MKSCFVLWSGGVDSTSLIIQLLEKGFEVRAGYIEICNNINKTAMELNAINRLIPMIEERFSNFIFEGVVYSASNHVGRSQLKLKQVPYFLHALLIAPQTDYRALGYVQNDSAIKYIEHIKTIYQSYNNIHNGNLPELIFPLQYLSKQRIVNYLNFHYPNILDLCVWCESPKGNFYTPCNACTPCIRRKELNEE